MSTPPGGQSGTNSEATPHAAADVRLEVDQGDGEDRSEESEQAAQTEQAEQTEEVDHDAALAEMEARWRRASADLDNLRKQRVREAGVERESERVRVARMWLPVVDHLELALDFDDSDGVHPVLKGVETIRDEAVGVLDALGFPRLGAPGEPFDPRLHEVVGVVDTDEYDPGTIVQVVRAGYGTADRLLRPAAVVVRKRG